MENELLNTMSQYTTIISSVVSIAVVSICAILSAVVTQIGLRKAKHSELTFQEKIQAYYDFIVTYDKYLESGEPFPSHELSNTNAKALLFSSKRTEKLIFLYSASVTDMVVNKTFKHSSSNGSDTQKLSELSDIRKKLLRSMKRDLRK